MIRNAYNAVRGYLGGIALGLGCLTFLSFVFTIPLTIFGAHFWGGFGFREGFQPSSAQTDAVVSNAFWWGVWHRLVQQLVVSVVLILFGLYEARWERKRQSSHQ
jgi:hypothetical protein